MARLDRIGFELLPQLLHVDAQVMGMLDMRGPPYLAQQLPVRDHHAEVLRQAGEKAKFQRREMDLHAVAPDDVLFQVRRDLAQLEYRLAGAGAGGVAQRRAHAREQLADAEGLGDIVVRAGVERLDLRALLRARREHQDRHRRPGANAPDHVHAVDVGQAEVDDRQVRLLAAGVDGAARAGAGLDDSIAFGGERGAQEPADLRLVLDDEDRPSGFGHASRGTCGAGSTGRVKRNAAPPSARVSAQMRPPGRRTMAPQRARPSPPPATVPSVLPRWNLANSCSGSPAGNPGPASSTETSRPSSCLSTRSVMRVPGGVCLAAFSIRLASTCSMSAASTRTSGSSIGRSTSTGGDSRPACRPRHTQPALSRNL